MSTPERASVHIVGKDDAATGPAVGAQLGPSELPPISAPPQEFENDLGGPPLQAPSEDEMLQSEGASVAERMRARFRGMASTKEFAVPGWELADGSPGLIVVARTFGDRKAYNTGVSNEAFIARSTHQLIYVEEDGSREVIPGGWGPALAEMIGVRAEKAADLVALVISKPDPNDEAVRIPNVTGMHSLATEIVLWGHNGRRGAEEGLGE
jgi:hypothetical protein